MIRRPAREISVVVLGGLEEIDWEVELGAEIPNVFLADNRPDNQSHKEGEKNEVQNREADNSSLPEFGHLGRIDWRSNLLGWSEPEEHNAVEAIGERNH